ALNMYTPWPESPSPRAITMMARLWYQVAIATPGLGQSLIRRTDFVRRVITAGAVHEAWTDAELESFTSVLRVPARASASVRLYRTFLLRELAPYLAGQFDGRRLVVPTLLLHGTRDLAIDHPPPSADEVTVAIAATGIAFSEVMARIGVYPPAPKPPCVLGTDIAGTVLAVGAEVDSLAVGDRVFGVTRYGGYAERANTTRT